MLIGLTGGIGAGKSLVASYFESLGVPVVDADKISRSLTAPNGEAIKEISSKFGPQFIDCTGALNRAKMRELVFTDHNALIRLEKILHPLIRKKTQKEIDSLLTNHKLVIYDCPLLIEKAELSPTVDRILVVDVTLETQITRVIKRNNLSYQQALKIISNQASRNERLSKAHDVIFNEFSPQELLATVKKICKKYRELAN